MVLACQSCKIVFINDVYASTRINVYTNSDVIYVNMGIETAFGTCTVNVIYSFFGGRGCGYRMQDDIVSVMGLLIYCMNILIRS